jgi:hypothetical protein
VPTTGKGREDLPDFIEQFENGEENLNGHHSTEWALVDGRTDQFTLVVSVMDTDYTARFKVDLTKYYPSS